MAWKMRSDSLVSTITQLSISALFPWRLVKDEVYRPPLLNATPPNQRVMTKIRTFNQEFFINVERTYKFNCILLFGRVVAVMKTTKIPFKLHYLRFSAIQSRVL